MAKPCSVTESYEAGASLRRSLQSRVGVVTQVGGKPLGGGAERLCMYVTGADNAVLVIPGVDGARMYPLERATVTRLTRPRPGLARVLVRTLTACREEPAYALDPIAASLEQGDDVLLNAAADRLGLGSSEGHVVVANLSRPEVRALPSGAEMKVRYTSSQTPVELAASNTMWRDVALKGLPVVVAELHSALAPILAGVRAAGSQARVAYLMPDWNALPAVLSDSVAQLREAGWVEWVITCGQAYGGNIEAASVPAGLALAAEVGAALVVVVGGPGHLGGSQPFGFSSTAQAEALHTAHALGGRPIMAPRVSEADARTRHRGVSHHTLALLERLLLIPIDVPLPAGVPDAIVDTLARAAARTGSAVHRVEVPDYSHAAVEVGIALASMGRTPDDDPLYFRCQAAAGAYVARLLEEAP